VQLNEDRTVLDEISDGSEFVIFGEDRLSLARLFETVPLHGRSHHNARKHLSGANAAVCCSRAFENGGNFIILDEPTNDLDLATLACAGRSADLISRRDRGGES